MTDPLARVVETDADPAVAAILDRQYAYFIYRSLECVSHMVSGTSRMPEDFDRTSRLYVRVINLLSRHGAALPAFDAILPASEGLAALLFHCSICHREAYWPALRTAHERCFGETRARVRAHGGGANAEDDFVALASLFERALREYEEALEAPGPLSFQAQAAVVQAGEWAGILLQEAKQAARTTH